MFISYSSRSTPIGSSAALTSADLFLVLGVVLHEVGGEVLDRVIRPADHIVKSARRRRKFEHRSYLGLCRRQLSHSWMDSRHASMRRVGGSQHLCFTKSDKPCSRMGTTVWSRYVRIGKACASIFSCASVAAFSASAACQRAQQNPRSATAPLQCRSDGEGRARVCSVPHSAAARVRRSAPDTAGSG